MICRPRKPAQLHEIHHGWRLHVDACRHGQQLLAWAVQAALSWCGEQNAAADSPFCLRHAICTPQTLDMSLHVSEPPAAVGSACLSRLGTWSACIQSLLAQAAATMPLAAGLLLACDSKGQVPSQVCPCTCRCMRWIGAAISETRTMPMGPWCPAAMLLVN